MASESLIPGLKRICIAIFFSHVSKHVVVVLHNPLDEAS